jgi:hypothetical protein
MLLLGRSVSITVGLLYLLITVAIWGRLIAWFWLKRQMGSVLLKISSTTIDEVMPLIVYGIALAVSIEELASSDRDMINNVRVVLFVSALCWQLMTLLTGIRFTENGLSRFGFFAKWKQVTSYKWPSEDAISITVDRRSFWTPTKNTTFYIPPRFKNDVNILLAQHLPQLAKESYQ